MVHRACALSALRAVFSEGEWRLLGAAARLQLQMVALDAAVQLVTGRQQALPLLLHRLQLRRSITALNDHPPPSTI